MNLTDFIAQHEEELLEATGGTVWLRFFVMLLIGYALFFSTGRLCAMDMYWTNTAGGNWSNPTNWSTGTVPGTNDNVFIVSNGTYTVTLDVNATIRSLTSEGASGQQTLLIAGSKMTLNNASVVETNTVMDLSGGGTLDGSGTLTLNGTMNWTGDNSALAGSGTLIVGAGGTLNVTGTTESKYWASRTLNNFGTVHLNSGGPLYAGNGAALNNEAGGVFDIQSDGIFGNTAGTLTVNNAGTLRKSAGSGQAYIGPGYFGSGSMINSGTVDIQSGTLVLAQKFITDPSSSFVFLVGSETNYGRLVVSGNFPLAGSLNVSVTNGFVPSVGDSFRIINWGSKSGGFNQANGFDLGNSLYFQGIADKSGLSLVAKTSTVPTPPPPTNLVDQIVAFGDTAVFSFSPVGVQPLMFQWSFNGTNLPGQTNASLIITNVQAGNLGDYCALVVDALNVSNTYCAMLQAINVPSISGQPAGQTVSPGANITLTATASGGGALRYQWRLNGENIPNATNSTYTITNAQPRNGGIYSVLVANPVRVISSSNAKVKVNTNSLPFADNFVARGSTNSFSGMGSGTNTNATHETDEPDHAGKTGAHSVWLQWTAPASGVATFNTRGSSFDTLLGIYTVTNGPVSLTNLVAVAGDDDRGDYFTSEAVFNAVAGTNYQIAVDGLSSASGDIVLSWNLDTNITQIPKIVQQPFDVTTAAGGSANFSVFGASTSDLTYQWYLGDWLAIADATNSSLSLTNVDYLDVGTYSVEVTAAGQTVESLPASLELGPNSDVHSFDKLDDLLASQSAQARPAAQPGKHGHGGGVITLSTISFPSVSIGTIGSQIINNFNSTTEQGEPIHSDVIGGSSRWYLLTAATNGTMVLDTLGSDIATVMSVYTGGDIFSLAKIAGDRNSAPDGVRSLVKFSAKSGTNYLIAVDGVNGAQGNIYLNWRLGIPPTAGMGATNLVVTNGSVLLLQAGVGSDVTAPFFQWTRNGLVLSGATNASYQVNGLQYNQVGSYAVVISNLVGAVINPVALVSADAPLTASKVTNGFHLDGSATQASVLQMSTNLSAWTPIYTNTTPLLPVSYTDTNATARPKGFYRLQPWP